MNDVDFCCVIKPVRKASAPLPKAATVKCKNCASLKKRNAQLTAERSSAFQERKAIESRLDRALNEVNALTERIQKQNRLLASVAEECRLFLNNLDGIKPPYCNTPEEVEKEVRQRCFNHMMTILKRVS